MNKKDFLIDNINNKKICLKGVGKMFYENGFPISMSIEYFKEKDIEVSILHVADECLKNGWSTKTIISKFKEDFEDCGKKLNIKELEIFCNSEYETQREILFKYLFCNNDIAIEFLKNKLNDISNN